MLTVFEGCCCIIWGWEEEWGGGHVAQVVEQQVWCSDGAGSIPQCVGIFLPELTFNADNLMVFEHPCVKQGFFSQSWLSVQTV